MTKKSLGEKIRKLREEYGLTQEELARKLGIPRPSVSQIESGQREVTSEELLALSRTFETSTDELLLDHNQQRKDVKLRQTGRLPAFNQEMFKQVLLYILNKCGGKPNVGKTVLYKLLYFCDFNYYEKYEEPLTGAAY
nr:helix-turn-helix domain-containing protein [Candidatus Saccharicenans sp.]